MSQEEQAEFNVEYHTPTKSVRKSLSGENRRCSVHFSTPKVLYDPINDDDEEKRLNKSKREREKQRKSVYCKDFISVSSEVQPADKNARSRRVSKITRRLAPEQLDDIFQKAIKLSTENKINMKNSWQLNLIDYMDQVMENTVGSNEENQNFQVASCTLDASIKIYSSRVDSIHSEAFKVLTGLTRVDGKRGANPQDDEETQNNGEKEDDTTDQKKETKKKKRAHTATLESNQSQLNVKKFEFEYTVEPLYHVFNSQNLDVGSAQSLLLNNMTINETCDVILDSSLYLCPIESNKQHVFPMEQLQSDTVTKQELMACDEVPNVILEEPIIDQAIVTDHMDTGEPETVITPAEQQISTEHEVSPQVLAHANQVLSAIEPMSQLAQDGTSQEDNTESGDEEDGLFDYGGFAVDTDAPVIGDEDAAQVQKHIVPGSNIASAAPDAPTQNRVVLELLVSSDNKALQDDYSYFDFVKLGTNWAGTHWKFSKKKIGASTEVVGGTTRKSSKKNCFSIDFHTLMSDEEYEKSFEVAKTKAANSLTEKTKVANKKSNLLPEDIHYDVSKLLQLFHFSNLRMEISKTRECSLSFAKFAQTVRNSKNPLQGSQDDRDDDEAGDIGGGGFGPDFGEVGTHLLDEQHDNAPMEGSLPVTTVPPVSAIADMVPETSHVVISEQILAERIQSNPLVEPLRPVVAKSSVYYDKKPTKVDVKALKDHIWTQLKQEEGNIGQQGNRLQQVEQKKHKSFSEVVTSMRKQQDTQRQSKVTSGDFTEASVPFCFICLLHLANEQGLEISSCDGLNDLSIQMPMRN